MKQAKVIKVVYAPVVTVGGRKVRLRLLPDKESAARGMIYLEKLPTALPNDVALVHTSVRPVRQLGLNGLRAWLEKPSARLEICDCAWAPELGHHFRRKRAE